MSNGITFRSFPGDTKSQVEAYIDTLHNNTDGGRLNVAFGEGCGYKLNGTPDYIKSNFMTKFEDFKYDNIFCSLNLFNKFAHDSKKSERSITNLHEIDTLMFDIDSKSETAYTNTEPQLMTMLLQFCRDNQFPVPNAFSYTGSGGVHLYYCIDTVRPRLRKAIRALKYIMADKIESFLRDFEDGFGIEYKVDTQVFDDMRLDRLPGTMNPKTGRMCEFFKIDNISKYTFKKLLGFGEVDFETIDWDRLSREAKKNFFYGKGKNTKIIVSQFVKKNEPKKKGISRPNNTLRPMILSRINGLFVLADNGFDFKHARESACFMLRQLCRCYGMKREEEIQKLHELNARFWEPLDDRTLLKQTDSPRRYVFTNESIAERLHLDVEDELFKKAFHCKRPKVVKEYGFTKVRLEKAKSYIAIAQCKITYPDATVNEIVAKTGCTVDQVKKANAQLNKNKGDCELWANTTLDDYDFITNYFDNYNVTHNNQCKKNDKRSNTVPDRKNSNSKFGHVIVRKIAGRNKPFEKIIVPDDFVCPPLNRDIAVHRCEAFLRLFVPAYTELKKVPKEYKYYDPLSRRMKRLNSSCLRAVNALVLLIGVDALSKMYLILKNKTLCNVPRYIAEHIVRGYWKYSQECISSFSEQQFGGGSIPVCPDAHTRPIYEGQIKEFPQINFADDKTFFYDGNVIRRHLWELGSCFPEGVTPTVPMSYDAAKSRYKHLQEAFRYQKKCYAKACKCWYVDGANKCVELAYTILEAIKNNKIDYAYMVADEVRCGFEEAGVFNPLKVNKTLCKILIDAKESGEKIEAYAS